MASRRIDLMRRIPAVGNSVEALLLLSESESDEGLMSCCCLFMVEFPLSRVSSDVCLSSDVTESSRKTPVLCPLLSDCSVTEEG